MRTATFKHWVILLKTFRSFDGLIYSSITTFYIIMHRIFIHLFQLVSQDFDLFFILVLLLRVL